MGRKMEECTRLEGSVSSEPTATKTSTSNADDTKICANRVTRERERQTDRARERDRKRDRERE